MMLKLAQTLSAHWPSEGAVHLKACEQQRARARLGSSTRAAAPPILTGLLPWWLTAPYSTHTRLPSPHPPQAARSHCRLTACAGSSASQGVRPREGAKVEFAEAEAQVTAPRSTAALDLCVRGEAGGLSRSFQACMGGGGRARPPRSAALLDPKHTPSAMLPSPPTRTHTLDGTSLRRRGGGEGGGGGEGQARASPALLRVAGRSTACGHELLAGRRLAGLRPSRLDSPSRCGQPQHHHHRDERDGHAGWGALRRAHC